MPIGYLKLVLNAVLQGYESSGTIDVERIYFYRQVTGKAIGKQFMNLAMQKALQLKKDIVFLKAMDSSIAAIAFYKKEGYSICGSLQLPLPEFELMQEKFRGMVIMKKAVGDEKFIRNKIQKYIVHQKVLRIFLKIQGILF